MNRPLFLLLSLIISLSSNAQLLIGGQSSSKSTSIFKRDPLHASFIIDTWSVRDRQDKINGISQAYIASGSVEFNRFFIDDAFLEAEYYMSKESGEEIESHFEALILGVSKDITDWVPITRLKTRLSAVAIKLMDDDIIERRSREYEGSIEGRMTYTFSNRFRLRTALKYKHYFNTTNEEGVSTERIELDLRPSYTISNRFSFNLSIDNEYRWVKGAHRINSSWAPTVVYSKDWLTLGLYADYHIYNKEEKFRSVVDIWDESRYGLFMVLSI